MAEIGARIRAERKKNKLSQHELASRLGMSRSKISQLETGDILEIGLQKVLRICTVLKLELVVRERTAPTWEQVNSEHEETISRERAVAGGLLKGLGP